MTTDRAVEAEAEAVWEAKRKCLMHDTRWGELPEMERIWIRAIARHVIAEKRRVSEVAAKTAEVLAARNEAAFRRGDRWLRPGQIVDAAVAKALGETSTKDGRE